ncbi:hypothetical protein E7V49_20620, partial [Escherichia coli]|nr:hypothetical protein [Escherichia coli]
LLRQKQKKLIMLPSETMIWQPEFTDKTLSRKIGAVQMAAPFNSYAACVVDYSLANNQIAKAFIVLPVFIPV